jgi:hypothetical protein
LTIEELAVNADFIGVVECTTAGGIVARYKVVESWKGSSAAGDEISIRVAPDYWGPQFPVTLVGERYVVTAFKAPPSTMMSTTIGGPIPLWWRNLPADYELPLFQGRDKLPAARGFHGISATKHKTLTALRKHIDQTIALGEIAVLRAQAEKYFPEDPKLARAKNVKAFLKRLRRVGKKHLDKKWVFATMLRRGGGKEVLAELQTIKSGWPLELPLEVIVAIQERLNPPQGAVSSLSPAKPSKPDKAELDRLRKLLSSSEPHEFYQAFPLLTRFDPGVVADHLLDWKTDFYSHGGDEAGYAVGSYFGFACEKDCKDHLVGLLTAKDPYIRVAAATYLTFYDEQRGVRALKKLCSLPGPPGAWAALNLARRGVKGAMPRLLKIFQVPPTGSMDTVNERNLVRRTRVLLSNSAKKSGLQQPVIPTDKTAHAYVAQWWKSNQANLTLHDPWLQTLAAQKVD